jgi:hypothetical protein
MAHYTNRYITPVVEVEHIVRFFEEETAASIVEELRRVPADAKLCAHDLDPIGGGVVLNFIEERRVDNGR